MLVSTCVACRMLCIVPQVLLEPTTIYVKQIIELHENFTLRGIVHITGGGMPENIPRVIPKGLGVQINAGSYEIPPLFKVGCLARAVFCCPASGCTHLLLPSRWVLHTH